MASLGGLHHTWQCHYSQICLGVLKILLWSLKQVFYRLNVIQLGSKVVVSRVSIMASLGGIWEGGLGGGEEGLHHTWPAPPFLPTTQQVGLITPLTTATHHPTAAASKTLFWQFCSQWVHTARNCLDWMQKLTTWHRVITNSWHITTAAHHPTIPLLTEAPLFIWGRPICEKSVP